MGMLFNAFLLMLWLRIVPVARDEAIGNPLVSVPLNQADRLADLVRPAFGNQATRPFGALVLLVVALVLRAAVAYAGGTPGVISIGPALFAPPPGTATVRDCLVMSALSFGWTIERLWMLVLFFGWLRRKRQPQMEDGLAQSLARPVSAAPRWMQLAMVVLLVVALSHATIATGFSRPLSEMADALPQGMSETWSKALRVSASVFPDFRRTTPLALALLLVGAFAEVFSVSSDVVVALVLASLIGLFLRLTYWLALGNAGLSYIVGSFFRGPMRWAGLSFAPLLYLLLAGGLYFVVLNVGVGLSLTLSGAITPEVLDAIQKAMGAPAP